MDQNNPQTNNTSSSQDLDSLLKEFQNLSTTKDSPLEENNVASVSPVNSSNVEQTSVTPISGDNLNQSFEQQANTNQVQGTVTSNMNFNTNQQFNGYQQTASTIGNQTMKQSQYSQSVSGQENGQSMTQQQSTNLSGTMGNNQMTAQPQVNQFAQQSTPNPEVDMSVLNETVPVHPDMNVTLNTDGGDKNPVDLPNNHQNANVTPNNNGGNNKGNLVFMIVIFLIVGLFILFIPKIDSFLKKKPGMEAKPTPTPTAQATNKPVEKKEKITVCTMPSQPGDNVETQVKYKYYHENGKITKLEETTEKKYLLNDETTKSAYSNDQIVCSSLATTYANILGYATSCEEKNNTFIVKKLYDLKSFINPTVITINGTQETITANVNFDDAIESVKEDMELQGATCK